MSTKPNLPSGKGAKYTGQIGNDTKFGKPFEEVDSGVMNMQSEKNDIGEKSGFCASTDDYIVKKGTAYGEAAKFNILPPGMDISDQPHRDIRDMPLRHYTGGMSFPDDGWQGVRDLKEGYAPKGSAN
jgi:hypothetical protein